MEETNEPVDISVRTIVSSWLKDNGYDGLCFPDMECGCPVHDLMPCDCPDHALCVAAHKELQDDGDWLMFPGKKSDMSNLITELRNKYPQHFAERNAGFILPTGWNQLFQELFAELRNLYPDFKIVQIKEKFGRLTVYTNMMKETFELTSCYSKKSEKVCLDCGNEGQLQTLSGWVLTICRNCNAKRLVKKDKETCWFVPWDENGKREWKLKLGWFDANIRLIDGRYAWIAFDKTAEKIKVVHDEGSTLEEAKEQVIYALKQMAVQYMEGTENGTS